MTFTQEEITAMAREASSSDRLPWNGQWIFQSKKELMAFAALVAEKAAATERDGCATLMQLGPQPVTGFGSKVEIGFGARTAYADAIRARGQKEGA